MTFRGLPLAVPHSIHLRGWSPIVELPRPRATIAERALASVTPGDVEAFHAANRARVERARAARGRP